MSKALHDEFGMQMHMSIATLRTKPCLEAFDSLGWLFNVVIVTVEGDPRFTDDLIHLHSGIRMMNQIADKCTAGLPLKDYELGCLTSAASVVDDILPRLDITKLHMAYLQLRTNK
jgi:hypothetical protein